jgi:hypothetical protein
MGAARQIDDRTGIIPLPGGRTEKERIINEWGRVPSKAIIFIWIFLELAVTVEMQSV